MDQDYFIKTFTQQALRYINGVRLMQDCVRRKRECRRMRLKLYEHHWNKLAHTIHRVTEEMGYQRGVQCSEAILQVNHKVRRFMYKKYDD